MNLFEYQGKRLFSEAGIPTPRGIVASSVEEAAAAADFGGDAVVKAQILMGGRGKAGAVRICSGPDEIKECVEHFLTTPVKGRQAAKVLIEERIDIRREYYFSILINRREKCISLMFSGDGGVEIESGGPGKIISVNVNPLMGLTGYQLKKLLRDCIPDHREAAESVVRKGYELFREKKMQLLEINPLAAAGDERVVAVDAKVILDDWAAEGIADGEDQEAGGMTAFERGMAKAGVTAVEMEGDVVVFGGGAGAAMATADSITEKGASVRAIIDLGTLPSDSADEGASDEAAETEKLILELAPKVILINFYFQAGRLDYECRTLKKAFGEASKRIPVVLRCKGRMAEAGRRLLSDTQIYVTDSYEDACCTAVRKLKEG